MSAEAFLEAWAVITQDLASLVDTALDVEPPGGLDDAWGRWLDRCDVAALSDDERLAEVKRTGQTKGAPLSEVQACLEALQRAAAARLAPLRATLTPPQAALVDASLRQFAATAYEQLRARATEKKKRMFGHARALAAQHRYDGHAAAQGYVLTCGACGALRLGDTLSCAFCGAEL